MVDKENATLRKLKINEFEFGLRPDLSKIGRYSNKTYSYKKSLLNPLAGSGNVDLILTGAFSNSLFVVGKGGGRFVFDAFNSKKDILKKRYGSDIMGLNQNTFNENLKNAALPVLIRRINEELRKA